MMIKSWAHLAKSHPVTRKSVDCQECLALCRRYSRAMENLVERAFGEQASGVGGAWQRALQTARSGARQLRARALRG